jgi:hypothetical protein
MGDFSYSVDPKKVITNRTVAEASPTAVSDGFDITVVKPHHLLAVYLGAQGGDCTLTGPVVVHGYHEALAAWFKLGVLNGGEDIVLVNNGSGFSEVLQHARNFSRLEFQEPALSANGYNAWVAGVDIT